ncbi:hypothetical protein CRYUN_Cryun27aG0059300 [Craigia yunnanensis]
MLTTGATVLPCKVKCLHQESLCRFRSAAILKTGLFLANISKQKNEQLFQTNQTCLPSLSVGGRLGLQTNRNRKMNNMVVCCSLEPGAPPFPFNLFPGSNNWQLWALGTVISVFLPFTRSKWGPLLKLKSDLHHHLLLLKVIRHLINIFLLGAYLYM